jgi:hypothetical protein
VQVRVPADQAPLFHIPGPHGGWFASLLYGYPSVDVPMRELCELIEGSRGAVIVARRLTHEEAGAIESSRVHSDAGVHAGIIATEEERFRRPRRRDKHGRKRSHVDQR